MRIDTHVGLTPPQQRGQTSLDSNSRDSGAGASRTREPLYAPTPASTQGSEGRATGRGPPAIRRAHRAEGECAIAGSEERAGNAGAAAEHRGAQRRIATAGAKREAGTSDRTGVSGSPQSTPSRRRMYDCRERGAKRETERYQLISISSDVPSPSISSSTSTSTVSGTLIL